VLPFAWSSISFAEENPASLFISRRDNTATLRFESLPVPGGAELLTLFLKDDTTDGSEKTEIPLVSILRDTLGNPDPQVHRLRYLWVHTLATPSIRQRIAAAIPFMYSRVGNAGTQLGHAPSPAMDLSTRDDRLWKNIWGFAVKGATLDPGFALVDMAVQTYGRNKSSYMKMQFARAAIAVDMTDPSANEMILSNLEYRQIQGQLAQRSKALASILNDDQLERFHLKEMIAMRQVCARNWELLRQRAEAEGLYFEPLLLPDGTATHVLLLAAREDLDKKHHPHFDDRFLSIAKPWGDKELLNWTGPTEVRYFDDENRPVSEGKEGARRVELIPLALYGLDHPKIPALLIDFRKPLNAKRRELSRQAMKELGTRLYTGSGYVSLMLSVGRTTVGFVSRRTGVDLFQPSREESYSQLKMVLSSSPGLSGRMRAEIARRIEYVAVNPLENDVETETELARNQYQALVEYAQRPGGLQADLDRERRAELANMERGHAARFLIRLSAIGTFGAYTHRDHVRPDLELLLDSQRRRSIQMAFLQDALKSGSHMDVDWDPGKVRDNLRDLAFGISPPGDVLADTTFRIFVQSHDDETRQVCLDTLYRLDTGPSRKKLQSIAQNPLFDMKWREASASYLGVSIHSQMASTTSANPVELRPVSSND
jgi:hypothetical protein